MCLLCHICNWLLFCWCSTLKYTIEFHSLESILVGNSFTSEYKKLNLIYEFKLDFCAFHFQACKGTPSICTVSSGLKCLNSVAMERRRNLILEGIVSADDTETVLSQYIHLYVKCRQCSSTDTSHRGCVSLSYYAKRRAWCCVAPFMWSYVIFF